MAQKELRELTLPVHRTELEYTVEPHYNGHLWVKLDPGGCNIEVATLQSDRYTGVPLY